MTLSLLPYQLAGAKHLAARKNALLADAPRVGKTGQAIAASDLVCAESVLWITTGSARADHAAAWREFSAWDRSVEVVYAGADAKLDKDVTIISWDLAVSPGVLPRLKARGFDVLVLDEGHRAKNREALRTKAIYGPKCDGIGGLIEHCNRVWVLTGTPAPNNYSELWPTLRALFPETIEIDGKPMSFTKFRDRYCVVRWDGFAWKIEKNRNADDLLKRIGSVFLRRTLDEVRPEIGKARTALLPIGAMSDVKALVVKERDGLLDDVRAQLSRATTDEQRDAILQRVDTSVKARLSRITGLAKVPGVVEWLRDEDPRKVVLFAHHHEVIDALAKALPEALVVTGATRPRQRDIAKNAFQTDPKKLFFIGQLQAAGEAIDLSAADELLFVESSWVPKDNEQAACRIMNINKTRPVLIRFATLAGSIDERIQFVAKRKLDDIRKIFQ